MTLLHLSSVTWWESDRVTVGIRVPSSEGSFTWAPSLECACVPVCAGARVLPCVPVRACLLVCACAHACVL